MQTRASLPVLGEGTTRILTSDNPHLFSFERELHGQRLRIVANFSEHPQYWHGESGLTFTDTLTGAKVNSGAVPLAAYQVLWLIS